MLIEANQLVEIETALRKVWNGIARDIGGRSPPISNRDAIETCIDAERLRAASGERGTRIYQLLCSLVADAGYNPTINYLDRKIRITQEK